MMIIFLIYKFFLIHSILSCGNRMSTINSLFVVIVSLCIEMIVKMLKLSDDVKNLKIIRT